MGTREDRQQEPDRFFPVPEQVGDGFDEPVIQPHLHLINQFVSGLIHFDMGKLLPACGALDVLDLTLTTVHATLYCRNGRRFLVSAELAGGKPAQAEGDHTDEQLHPGSRAA